jgi:hypothetical protein
MNKTNLIHTADCKNSTDNPNCNHCRHFYITWDAKMPYGCRAMGFKSQRQPASEVLDIDGSPCVSFNDRSEKENLNDRGASIKPTVRHISVKA